MLFKYSQKGVIVMPNSFMMTIVHPMLWLKNIFVLVRKKFLCPKRPFLINYLHFLGKGTKNSRKLTQKLTGDF